MTRLRTPDERGTSLAEMLVTVVLLGVLGTITMTAVLSSQRTTTATTTRTEVTGQVREAQEVMARTLRLAVRPAAAVSSSLYEAGDTLLSFYANDHPGSGPSRVTYSVTAGLLTEEVQPATTTTGAYTWTAPIRRRVLLRDVATVAGAPVFRYDDDSTTCTGGCPLALPGSPARVANADLPRITMVEVALTVRRAASGSSRPLTVTGRTGVVRNSLFLKAP